MPSTIIDISSNNETINWHAVIQAGIADVIIRLSLGTGDYDKLAVENAKNAAAAGLQVSYYHLAYPDKRSGSVESDAKDEARYFTGLVKNGTLPSAKWLAVDLEAKDNGIDTPLNNSEYLKWLNIFLAEVYALTRIKCMIYGNKYYLDAHLPAGHRLGEFPLWIANYNSLVPPLLPNGWDRYFLWQYTKHGIINGMEQPFDMSRINQPPDQNSDKSAILKVASGFGQKAALKKIFDFQPASAANFWAVVDFNMPSSQERLFIFNVRTQTVRKFLVAHGSGSGEANADKFSNDSGSHCSSLGIYKTLDTYIGKHGESLRINGLESTNSNAKNRFIVIHSADYVVPNYLGTGRAGRSEGCFAVNPKDIAEVIECLKGGSYLIAWHNKK